MTCSRCGGTTPRLTLSQRRCPPCERDVARLIEADARRRAFRIWTPRDLTGVPG